MAVICRLLELPPDGAERLAANPGSLAEAVQSSKVHSDVYRYWDAIQYLLARHSPGSPAATWLRLGKEVSTATDNIPAARIISPPEVSKLNATLVDIEPDALAPGYDAETLDRAGIFPRCWKQWEETFDPLGQVLEHYSFLQYSTRGCVSRGNALLLYFIEDGVG